MSRVLRSPADSPWILYGSGVSCRVRPWPYEPRTAQLVFFNQGRMPSSTQLAEWLVDIAAAGYTAVRTGAIRAASSAVLRAEGFVTVQTLILLQHDDVASVKALRGVRTRRLHERDHGAAAGIDLAAFGQRWAVDAPGIGDIRTATVHHRARGIDVDGHLAAYAVSGRDQQQGFLQRLAVDPRFQRRGLGRALTIDSLRWMRRRHVRRALVNTHTDNAPALALYRSAGFVDDSEPLLVLERAL